MVFWEIAPFRIGEATLASFYIEALTWRTPDARWHQAWALGRLADWRTTAERAPMFKNPHSLWQEPTKI